MDPFANPSEVYSEDDPIQDLGAMVRAMFQQWNLVPEEEAMIIRVVKILLSSVQQVEDVWTNDITLRLQNRFGGNSLVFVSNFIQKMLVDQDTDQSQIIECNSIMSIPFENTTDSENLTPQKSIFQLKRQISEHQMDLKSKLTRVIKLVDNEEKNFQNIENLKNNLRGLQTMFTDLAGKLAQCPQLEPNLEESEIEALGEDRDQVLSVSDLTQSLELASLSQPEPKVKKRRSFLTVLKGQKSKSHETNADQV
ncbi:hypothetical protein NADFUDRAFT_53703 [Nadsonia fulvescens var. elongata DSM 6958]|uniref:Uncharacterized protein n=1 Tax=Nadsonia fulvescens var. elongata DSM 6958 TaxID=857566 RepID=A0A1E3PCA4_9ASCO|nr:hypothetical protein NADFUDRAFT_53703 [Nadsonia fulvescens var. elongata DSM 6958]